MAAAGARSAAYTMCPCWFCSCSCFWFLTLVQDGLKKTRLRLCHCVTCGNGRHENELVWNYRMAWFEEQFGSRSKNYMYHGLQIFITTESSSIVSCLPDQLNPERLGLISDHHLFAATQALKRLVPRKSHRWSCTLTSDYHSGSNSTRKSCKMRDYEFEVQF